MIRQYENHNVQHQNVNLKITGNCVKINHMSVVDTSFKMLVGNCMVCDYKKKK